MIQITCRTSILIYSFSDHFLFCPLQLLFRRFYSGSSSDDECTMYSDRNVINRRNVREDPHTAYRPDIDFLVLEVTAQVIAAAFEVFGIARKNEKPNNLPLPENLATLSRLKKLQFLHKAAGMIVDKLVVNKDMMDNTIQTMLSAQERQELINQTELNPEGRFPCRFPGCFKSFKYNGRSRKNHELSHDPPIVMSENYNLTTEPIQDLPTKHDYDDMFNYNTALLAEGLFFLNFLDAVAEGDGERIIRQFKYLMLLCKADDPHSTKYALKSLYQLLLVNGSLSENEAEVFTWNRSVNNHGGIGMNIPFDLEVEHSNNYIKQGIGNLGVNVTENAVTRIARAEKPARSVLKMIDKSLQCSVRSGKHVSRFPYKDFDELLQKLVDKKVFAYQEGRLYRHFKHFQRDPLRNLDMSKIYAWITDHKKKLSLGVKAR